MPFLRIPWYSNVLSVDKEPSIEDLNPHTIAIQRTKDDQLIAHWIKNGEITTKSIPTTKIGKEVLEDLPKDGEKSQDVFLINSLTTLFDCSPGNLDIYTPDEVPLFVIPGVLGNGSEYQSVIEELRKSGDNRPIWVYYDPIITPDKKKRLSSSATVSQEEHAQLIADSMVDILPPGRTPYLIIGYSYGCTLAALAAQQLKKQDQDPRLLLIDGSSPECSKAYFSTKSPALVADLVKIVKYAAKLSIIDDEEEDDLAWLDKFDASLPGLQALSPTESIDRIATAILEHIKQQEKSINADDFTKYLLIAKRAMTNMISSEIQPVIKFEKIVMLMTDETAKKYKDPYGGWEKYADKIALIEDKELQSASHTDLLKFREDNKLVNAIKVFLKQETRSHDLLNKQLSLFENQLQLLFTAFCKKPEDVVTMHQSSAPIAISQKRSSRSPSPERRSPDLGSSPGSVDSTDSLLSGPKLNSVVVESFSDEDNKKDQEIDLAAASELFQQRITELQRKLLLFQPRKPQTYFVDANTLSPKKASQAEHEVKPTSGPSRLLSSSQ